MKKVGWFLVFGLFLILLVSVISLASLIRADELQVTEEHPFLVNGAWIPAKELAVGDELLTIDGKKVRITEIEEVVSDKSFLVYNFEDSFGINNYVVNGGDGFGVIVHNSGKIIPLKTKSSLISKDEDFFRLAQIENLEIYPINNRGIELDSASLFNRERSMLPKYYSGWFNLDELQRIGSIQRLQTYSEWKEIG